MVLCGWGTTVLAGPTPDKLQYINLRTLSVEKCSELNESPEIKPAHLCTLTKSGEGACHGDSGGALQYRNKVAGIVSFGTPCAVGFPDVFTRVSAYNDWINEHML